MAKKTNNEGGTPTRYDVHDWTPEFLANQTPLSLHDMQAFLSLWLAAPDEGLGMIGYGDDRCTAAMCPVFIGDAGVGKSIVIRRWAEHHGYAFSRMPMGESMEEDSMPVVKREYDENGRHVYSFAPWMPMARPDSDSGLGIMFADEIGTGAPGHQNLMATLLTDGYRNGYFGARVHPGWFWVAASNPMSSDYHLNWQLDRRLRDRLFPVFIKPTDDEVMYVMSSNNLMPKSLYGFLLMNRGHIGCISPRSWEQVGWLMKRHEAQRTMSEASLLNAMKLKVPPATVDAFRKYLLIGDNPDEYPILATEVINSDAEASETHIKRLKKWGETGREGLVSVSVFDLRGYLSDETWTPTRTQADRMLDFILSIPKPDLLSDLLSRASTSVGVTLRDAFIENRTKSRVMAIDGTIRAFQEAIGLAIDVPAGAPRGKSVRGRRT